ncbi:hypothetical protein COV53_04680 [Candidatus Gottesmanbacteria bacterium CG11_big_fil_rev_8_21_14_0_20_37_11]|uniref:Aspartate--tRNA(Asp/Asn) ligase n=3 Tax=Candidatus Gottesmaniibacteriota TaxID=1752720 RepID=A0A2M7RRR9_9BACT|nr:MAG: hypothetical protein AUJ73_02210 [Candidatus Gottesmanbacteria bacterium CG1_02_37_22]PIP33117.1 MAG: hypothetical protein COX23_01115 [Candidatus Gottesmanbacteria bacterium CG23_combo_of_CG06-09_8_20_14_all_37_19]PIR08125.1 MAG: hypothetical protein COV53_04680 [Candidatus Gottesmanbacteria bacterium CG11_big_fil_rev_8_21_14_0_20_37_11]PIZ02775.1 MAG: aspartate--tRNA ligase [Candidatus Gottesmanbacteria bacterium CG_4_10_14_0_8_um_filter_37_24]
MQRTLIFETVNKISENVIINGWVAKVRNHGGISFMDIRDRSGIIQCVCMERNIEVNTENVVEIAGIIKKRPEKMVNPKISTGSVELEIKKIKILTKSLELPFPIDTDGYELDEEQRLKYRYVDIRRQRLSRNLRIRSQVTTYIRNFLTERDFVEIETPMLTKTTPEGARDFIVPSRLQKGKFYALPQSPQQYKQLLMVAGIEKYFQIVRCFRDEDPRADRAYGEFTQLDLEMSFVTQEDILQLIEKLFTSMVLKIFPGKKISQSPWPRIPHKEAISSYGTDKPDLRKNKNDKDELAFAWIIGFPLFMKQTKDDYFHGSGRAKFAPSHHMFTAPHPEDIHLLDKDPLNVRGLQHDLVLNGYEVGGGSIRIHDPKIQEKVFDLIGFSQNQKEQFKHILTAFKFGVPPHGGIAPGIDRLLMVLLGEPNLREVIAFPMTSSGQTAVMDAPSFATNNQLEELGIKIQDTEIITDLYDRIVSLLKEKKVVFHVLDHEVVHTSKQAAIVRGTKLSEGAKALILFADGREIMVVIPADLKLNMAKLKKYLNAGDVRLAKAVEVKKITGIEIGAVPPYGKLFNLPLYIDKRLFENNNIVYNAGLHTKSIKMKANDFKITASGVLGDFAKSEND